MSSKLELKESKDKKPGKKIKNFFGDRFKKGPIKCPFCDELYHNLRELGTHFKERHIR